MTINTQVNRDRHVCSRQSSGIRPIPGGNGTKSTNTMWAQEFKGNFPKKAIHSDRRAVSQAQQEKTLVARRELVTLTKHLKQAQQEQAERFCSKAGGRDFRKIAQ